MQPVHRGGPVPPLGPGHPGIFGRPGPAERAHVGHGGPLQGSGVLIHQPAHVGGCRRHVTGGGTGAGQLLRRPGQIRGPGLVISGQGAADQQDRGLRIRCVAAEHGQPEMLLELMDVRVQLHLCAGHDTPHSA